MNNTITSIIIGVLVVALAGWLVLWQKGADAPVPSDTPSTAGAAADTELTTLPEVTGITSVEVAAHNSRETCWSTINGNVYDLTSWIPEHPGGEQAILQLCGTDGSAKFNGKHGDAPKQAAILIGFKLDVAAQ